MGGLKITILKSALFTIGFYVSALLALGLPMWFDWAWNTNLLLCGVFCVAAMVYACLAETEPSKARFGWITVGFQIARLPILLIVGWLFLDGTTFYILWMTELYLDILTPLIAILSKAFLKNGKYK